MKFEVDAKPAEIAAFVRALIQIPGASSWSRCKEDFRQRITANPLIEQYLDLKFPLERAMLHAVQYLRQTGRFPSPLTAQPAMGAFYSFAGMLTRVHARLNAAAKQRLEGRIRGALKDNIGLRPLAFEMRTMAHLMATGFEVDLHDLHHGGGYDFLATKSSGVALEIECKSVSGDLGRKIHLLRQYQLGEHLLPLMRDGEKGLVRLAVAKLPDRLFPATDTMKAVAATIGRALITRTTVYGELCCSVSYKELPLYLSPFDRSSPVEREVLEYCRSALGYEIGHVIIVCAPKRSATVVALCSEKKDEFLSSVEHQLREASKQLSGSRPGVICMQFENVTSAQLREIAGAPIASSRPTALQLMTGKFFAREGRSHVHTIAYVAPGPFSTRTFTLAASRHTVTAEDAASYNFINKKHPLADDAQWQAFK